MAQPFIPNGHPGQGPMLPPPGHGQIPIGGGPGPMQQGPPQMQGMQGMPGNQQQNKPPGAQGQNALTGQNKPGATITPQKEILEAYIINKGTAAPGEKLSWRYPQHKQIKISSEVIAKEQKLTSQPADRSVMAAYTSLKPHHRNAIDILVDHRNVREESKTHQWELVDFKSAYRIYRPLLGPAVKDVREITVFLKKVSKPGALNTNQNANAAGAKAGGQPGQNNLGNNNNNNNNNQLQQQMMQQMQQMQMQNRPALPPNMIPNQGMMPMQGPPPPPIHHQPHFNPHALPAGVEVAHSGGRSKKGRRNKSRRRSNDWDSNVDHSYGNDSSSSSDSGSNSSGHRRLKKKVSKSSLKSRKRSQTPGAKIRGRRQSRRRSGGDSSSSEGSYSFMSRRGDFRSSIDTIGTNMSSLEDGRRLSRLSNLLRHPSKSALRNGRSASMSRNELARRLYSRPTSPTSDWLEEHDYQRALALTGNRRYDSDDSGKVVHIETHHHHHHHPESVGSDTYLAPPQRGFPYRSNTLPAFSPSMSLVQNSPDLSYGRGSPTTRRMNFATDLASDYIHERKAYKAGRRAGERDVSITRGRRDGWDYGKHDWDSLSRHSWDSSGRTSDWERDRRYDDDEWNGESRRRRPVWSTAGRDYEGRYNNRYHGEGRYNNRYGGGGYSARRHSVGGGSRFD